MIRLNSTCFATVDLSIMSTHESS